MFEYIKPFKTREVMSINLQPDNFSLETTTLWSFPDRGKWATHSGDFRGNWSPYIPRNIILRYSIPNEWILDQFVGSGTTLVEAKLLGRNGIGVDVNDSSLIKSKTNLKFDYNENIRIYLLHGDARNLNFIRDESIDLICTHPPYADIINYSVDNGRDISLMQFSEFIIEMHKVAEEAYRVLKTGKICAIMMGDMRKNGNVIPLGFKVMECFLNSGFKSKEIIIKEQHNCKSTKFWIGKCSDFLLIAHEYIFVFEK
ncbi:TRM11 family SAM-dependent methyltransferase [Sedimentibacter saalensis]|nr:DNA methyltransferase [Sedimentibacter saalensis]